MSLVRLFISLLLVSMLFTVACSKDKGDCDQTVNPSSDDQGALQTAMIQVKAGGTICLGPGTYSLKSELSLNVENVTIKGKSKELTVLDFAKQDSGANGVSIQANGVTLEDLQVKDSKGDGIRATNVTDITFRRISVIWSAAKGETNGAYGLYPVGCTNVLVEDSLVVGARDAGIYVGQSTNILVRNNEVHGNVAGIEIENSQNAEVVNNNVHDNVAGILVFNLPGLERYFEQTKVKIHKNTIEKNNLANWAAKGTTVAIVPGGTGIMLFAADGNEIHNNTIKNHKSIGIVIFSYNQLLGVKPFEDANYNIWPEGNWIHDNTFADNGADPLIDAATKVLLKPTDAPVADMLLDGCSDDKSTKTADEQKNCFSNNGTATFMNFALCDFGKSRSTDIEAVTCTKPALPEISLGQ